MVTMLLFPVEDSGVGLKGFEPTVVFPSGEPRAAKLGFVLMNADVVSKLRLTLFCRHFLWPTAAEKLMIFTHG